MIEFLLYGKKSLKTLCSAPKVILIMLWVLMQVFVYLKFGLTTAVDSSLYIADAKQILLGQMPQDRNVWYSGYSIFLAVIFKLGGSLEQVIFSQMIFSGIAAYCIFILLKDISKNTFISFIATVLYIIWFKIHQWNTIIYSDSLFTSAAIITLTGLHFSKKKWHYILLIPLIFYTALIRPTGVGFLAGAVGFLVFNLRQKFHLKKISVFLYAAAFISIIITANFILKDYIPSIISSYSKAEIIYPDIQLGVIPPEKLTVPDKRNAPLLQLIQFAINNSLYFLKITIFKTALFLGNVKPYFSLTHNLAIILFLYPIYIMAAYGITKYPLTAEKIFMIIFILFEIMIVSLTSENWDGRFLIPILPYIFILAAYGMYNVVSNALKSRPHSS